MLGWRIDKQDITLIPQVSLWINEWADPKIPIGERGKALGMIIKPAEDK